MGQSTSQTTNMSRLTNSELARKYKIAVIGGINKSTTHGVYVLKINNNSVYHDKVYSGVIHYVGQGQTGDQKFTRNNRGLATSNWPCHVWQKDDDGLYEKIGEYYVDFHYWTVQGGRRVIVFKLVKYTQTTHNIIALLIVLLMVIFNPLTVSQVYSRCAWYGSLGEGGNSTETSHYSQFPILKSFY